MRDDLGDQVKKAFRGQRSDPDDVWGTATTEPPDALDQAPECAWCPICRAARRMAQAQAQAAAQAGARSRAGSGTRDAAGPDVPAWYGAADAIAGVARDALASLDAILSYRPGEASTGEASRGEAGTGEPGEPGESANGAVTHPLYPKDNPKENREPQA
jgi:hypothetical protein